MPVASLEAPFRGLKVANTSLGNLNFLVHSLAYPNGTAYNAELAEKPRHSGKLYSDNYPRHWDTWLAKQRYSVFAGSLIANSSYSLAPLGMRNLLQGIQYTVTRPESPVQPFGGTSDYDISPDGNTISFLSKATHLSQANFTASYIYLGPFDGSEVPIAFNGPGTEPNQAGHMGASAIATFSPDNSKLAYIQQDGIYYESDRWQIYVLDIDSSNGKIRTWNWKHLASSWDRWPDSIQWTPDSNAIFVTAEEHAIKKVFSIPLNASEDYVPKNLTSFSSVDGFTVLPDSSILVSASAMWTSRDFYTKTNEGKIHVLFSAAEVDSALADLSPELVDEFWYTGSLGIKLQALIIKPTNFAENKTYPLAYIVHGGPQGSNSYTWRSALWNYQVWADQGYVVVAPNPTGSIGFGQHLIDAIQGNWGSHPYEDLVLGWEYIKENISFVDTDNGVEVGASFGGFMTNWIQGHDLGRKFKALVTHDGISNTRAAYGTDELWFMRHDFNGTPFDTESTYAKWDPMNHVANWSTPHFIIHNTLDYRLPEADGLAMFNLLQTKGVPSRFLNFPDEGHIVSNPENSLFWHTEVFNWINHYSSIKEPIDDSPVEK
jgi:dipeptidyl aminopeptidase/acylaminoacyl peptidase